MIIFLLACLCTDDLNPIICSNYKVNRISGIMRRCSTLFIEFRPFRLFLERDALICQLRVVQNYTKNLPLFAC